MPKRPDTLESVLLALELLKRIPRHGKISAPQLHAQLNEAGLARELRTIQRQLEMLSRHFDIERDERDKPYGYKWKERATGLSVPSLSPQESLLLMLAEQHLKNLLPASLTKSMDGFFAQARSTLDQYGDARKERAWLSKVRVVSTTQPLLPPKVRPGVFDAISNALYENRRLEVDYTNAGGKSATSDIMPLGLAQQGPRLYLVCRFKGFDNERSLAVHRIQAARMSAFKFEYPKEFDLKKYDGGQSKSWAFPYEGEYDIYCDLHVDMNAKVKVVESDRIVTIVNGSFSLTGVPAGKYKVVAWAPDSDESKETITVVAGEDTKVPQLNVQLGNPTKGHTRKNGTPYPTGYKE